MVSHHIVDENQLDVMNWHWHYSIQFCYVKKGSVLFQINHDKILINENEGLFINSKQLHRTYNEIHHQGEYLCFDLHPTLLYAYSGSLINNQYIKPYVKNNKVDYCVLKRDVSWQEEILCLLEVIYSLYLKENQELEIHIDFQMIWLKMYKNFF